MFLAEKKENEDYINRLYKRNYEIEEIIWKIERVESEYARKQEEQEEILQRIQL